MYYNIVKLRWDCGGCLTAARDDGRLYSHATFSCEESRHLNDVSSHFKLASRHLSRKPSVF